MSVNKVIIVGNLGQDPEVRYTTGGDAVANISVATTERWKDKSGEKKEKTEWHRLVAFGRNAEVAGEYLKKGSQAYFEGRLQTKKYTDKEGVEKYSTEIVIDRLQLLGKREGGGRDDSDTGERQAPATRQPARQAPAKAAATHTDTGDLDDDIPF